MNGRRLLLLGLVVLGLLALGTWPPGRQDVPAQAVAPTQMGLALTPERLTVPPAGEVVLTLQAGTEAVGFARVELRFDPALLAVERVEPGSALAPVSISTVDEANATGRIVIAQRAPAGSRPLGQLQLASVRFSPATSEGEVRTQVTVDPARVQILTQAGAEAAVSGGTSEVGVNPEAYSCLPIMQIPAGECAALKAFYAETGGEGWGNWFESTTPCSDWLGVSCAGGHVTGLALGEQELAGRIHGALGDLAYLAALDLGGNRLEGAIPTELGQLGRLQTLDLHGNRLTGAVPPELRALTALQALDLGYNLLRADDGQTAAFLNARDPDWAQTQTVPPPELTVVEAGSSEVVLSWVPIAYRGEGALYEVYVAAAAGGPYRFQGTTADTAAGGYTVTGLESERDYFFKVRTYTPTADRPGGRFSAFGEPASTATTLPPPVVWASQGSDAEVVYVSWEAVTGASSYKLFRATTGTVPQAPLTTQSGTTFVDRTAAKGEIYFYWVSACNADGCSGLSEVAWGWLEGLPAIYLPLVGR